MHKKKLVLLFCFSLLIIIAFAQGDNPRPTKKGSMIGFSANTANFGQPLSVGNSFNNANFNPGFSIMYWKGLGNHIDFSLRYNGIFTDYSKNPSTFYSSGYGNEFEASLHARLLTDGHLLGPFISAGIGIGGYGGRWAPYVPLGGGLQFNFASETYLFLQMNYRATLDKTNLGNSLFYSFGVAETISLSKPAPRPKVVVIPAVQPPKDTDGVVFRIVWMLAPLFDNI
jgi:OmpA-OmpF porin, OOP family